LYLWRAPTGELRPGSDRAPTGLVRSLEAVGRSTDAQKRAAEGKRIAESLDATSDVNRLAARWLKRYLGEKVD
jgi:hypothetical protein